MVFAGKIFYRTNTPSALSFPVLKGSCRVMVQVSLLLNRHTLQRSSGQIGPTEGMAYSSDLRERVIAATRTMDKRKGAAVFQISYSTVKLGGWGEA